MSFTIRANFPQSPAEVFDFLGNPAHRSTWQSSLRAIADLTPGETGVGTSWHDVTWPGLRPHMEITVFEPNLRWAERGTWRGLVVVLHLDFVANGSGTTVHATASSQATGWRRILAFGLDLVGPLAAKDDLRRAAKCLAKGVA